jgi:microcystin-dependent protein
MANIIDLNINTDAAGGVTTSQAARIRSVLQIDTQLAATNNIVQGFTDNLNDHINANPAHPASNISNVTAAGIISTSNVQSTLVDLGSRINTNNSGLVNLNSTVNDIVTVTIPALVTANLWEQATTPAARVLLKSGYTQVQVTDYIATTASSNHGDPESAPGAGDEIFSQQGFFGSLRGDILKYPYHVLNDDDPTAAGNRVLDLQGYRGKAEIYARVMVELDGQRVDGGAYSGIFGAVQPGVIATLAYQGSTPPAAGNGNTYISFPAEDNFRIGTSNNARFQVYPAGEVRIGGGSGGFSTTPGVKLLVSDSTPANGTIRATGNVEAAAFVGDGSQLTGLGVGFTMPTGSVIMWSGNVGSVPTDWFLCDGAAHASGRQLTGNKPDLRGKFIAGYSGTGDYASVGATGGADSVTLATSELPSHTHAISGSITSGGTHTHSGNTSNTGAHDHNASFSYGNTTRTGCSTPQVMTPNGSSNKSVSVSNDGAHSHNVTIGSSGAHNHTHNLAGASAGGGGSHENRPSFYTLAYLIYNPVT